LSSLGIFWAFLNFLFFLFVIKKGLEVIRAAFVAGILSNLCYTGGLSAGVYENIIKKYFSLIPGVLLRRH